MAKSKDPPSIPPTRAAQPQTPIAATAAMHGQRPGEPPPTGLNYIPKARATSLRKWLPSNLGGRFTIVDVLKGGAQADIYVVKNAAGEQSVAKIYQSGTLIKEVIFAKVRGRELRHVVRIHDFGYDDGHWWETQEYAPHGTLLDLIGYEGPKLPVDLVREVVSQIHFALTELHRLNIEHRDLKPANLLVRSRQPLDLAVTDFGVSSDMQGSLRNTGIGGTHEYAPPEGQGIFVRGRTGNDESNSKAEDPKANVFRERWDNWSMGMIIVEMLTGEHPFAKKDAGTVISLLFNKNPDLIVAGVTDTIWRKLCRGLLRRDNSLRWGNQEVAIWLKNPDDPRLTVADEGSPATAGYSFAGKLYYTLQDLGEAFYGNWAAARRTWELDRNGLLRWIQNDLGQSAIVDAMEEAIPLVRKLNLPAGKREDAEALTIATLLAPAVLPKVNGVEISLKNIAELTAQAMKDRATVHKLVDLLQSQVLKIAKASPDGVRLAAIADTWESACRNYDRLRSDIVRQGVNAPELSDDTRITLFAAQFPDSPTIQTLRESALNATSSDAKSCDWFASMGSPSEADAGTLVIMAYAADVAEQSVRRERHAREKATHEEEQARLYESALLNYGGPARSALGLAGGSIAGIVTAFVPGFIAFLPISWIWGDKSATTIALIWIVGFAIVGGLSPWVELPRLVGNTHRKHGEVKALGIFYSFAAAVVFAGVLFYGIPEVRSEYQRFSQQEVRRVAALTARVWAASRSGDKETSHFTSQEDFYIHVDWSGDFKASDSRSFHIVDPDGQDSTCSHSYCMLSLDQGSSHRPGIYQLEARVASRVLSIAKFTVGDNNNVDSSADSSPEEYVDGLIVEYKGRATGIYYTLRSDKWFRFDWPKNYCLSWNDDDKVVNKPAPDNRSYLVRSKSGQISVAVDTFKRGQISYGNYQCS